MAVICHRIKNLCVKNLIVILFVCSIPFKKTKIIETILFFKLLTVFYSGKKGRNYQFKEQKKKQNKKRISRLLLEAAPK